LISSGFDGGFFGCCLPLMHYFHRIVYRQSLKTQGLKESVPDAAEGLHPQRRTNPTKTLSGKIFKKSGAYGHDKGRKGALAGKGADPLPIVTFQTVDNRQGRFFGEWASTEPAHRQSVYPVPVRQRSFFPVHHLFPIAGYNPCTLEPIIIILQKKSFFSDTFFRTVRQQGCK
jgi:hypothetical protein